MIRQYGGQRRRGGVNPLGVGVIATGSIYYLQDRGFFHDRFGGRAVCRNPWIVDGFLNGTCAAARRNRDTGRWEDVTLSGRSDTAVVRSLRDGRRRIVAVRVLERHDDLGLTMQPTIYPSVPDLSLYRRRAASAPAIRADAADGARDRGRGVILPARSPAPVADAPLADAPPVRPAVPTRPQRRPRPDGLPGT